MRHLTDQAKRNDETIREITGLGLGYSLLTPYTSFVAIDETPRTMDQVATTVRQPLPLPQGVSESAVGGGGGTDDGAERFSPGARMPSV